MFDLHYDLLTYIYINRNDLNKVKKYCKKIFTNNISGGIFNLFYMSETEMKNELNIDKEEINVVENLKLVKKIIEENNLIPMNVNYVFGIEGLDYLENINDIDILYELGVKSVNPVWNNENKFGGGIRSNIRLTRLGEKLILKLIDKNIAIDLSHSNEKTFYDITNLCKQLETREKRPIIIASHSNSKKICNVPRNLSDKQLLEIKNLNGIVGIVEIKNFCKDTQDLNRNFEIDYVNHINHIRQLLGGVENIGISTDDMSYYKIEPEYYQRLNIYKLNDTSLCIKKLLLNNGYTMEEIEKITYSNAKRLMVDNILT